MFDELKVFENITNNISEIQVLNEKTYGKIIENLNKGKDPGEHLANLKMQLEMQENLIRLCFEMEHMMYVEDDFEDEDDDEGGQKVTGFDV